MFHVAGGGGGADRGGRSMGRWPSGVNANVFPGLIRWQTG